MSASCDELINCYCYLDPSLASLAVPRDGRSIPVLAVAGLQYRDSVAKPYSLASIESPFSFCSYGIIMVTDRGTP